MSLLHNRFGREIRDSFHVWVNLMHTIIIKDEYINNFERLCTFSHPHLPAAVLNNPLIQININTKCLSCKGSKNPTVIGKHITSYPRNKLLALQTQARITSIRKQLLDEVEQDILEAMLDRNDEAQNTLPTPPSAIKKKTKTKKTKKKSKKKKKTTFDETTKSQKNDGFSSFDNTYENIPV